MKYLQVEGHNNLYRDPKTNSILNKNEKGYEEYQVKEYLNDAFRNIVYKYNPKLDKNKIHEEKTPYYVK